MYLRLVRVFDRIPWKAIQTPISKLQKYCTSTFLLFLVLTAPNGIWCLCKRRLWPHVRTNDTLYFYVSVLITFCCPSRLANNLYISMRLQSPIMFGSRGLSEVIGNFPTLLMSEALSSVDSKCLQPYKWFHIFLATSWTIAFGECQQNSLKLFLCHVL